MTENNRVAKEFRKLRESLGMSQETLSKRSHVKQANISRFENGKVNVSIGYLTKIAKPIGYYPKVVFKRIPKSKSCLKRYPRIANNNPTPFMESVIDRIRHLHQ